MELKDVFFSPKKIVCLEIAAGTKNNYPSCLGAQNKPQKQILKRMDLENWEFRWIHWFQSDTTWSFTHFWEKYRAFFWTTIFADGAGGPQHQVGPTKLNQATSFSLGGGFTSTIFYFHLETWGRWTHFDEHIFQMGWWKTTNQFWTAVFLSVDFWIRSPPRWLGMMLDGIPEALMLLGSRKETNDHLGKRGLFFIYPTLKGFISKILEVRWLGVW